MTICSSASASVRPSVMSFMIWSPAIFPMADYYEVSLQNGDFLLLCSDGLSNMVTDLEMLDYAKEYPDPELLCRALMSKALKRGARDNVTVLAVMK